MKKIKTILILACLTTMVLVLSACGSKSEAVDWPTTGLAAQLPEPPDPKGEITLNNDTYFDVDIDASESDFEDYVEACVNHGFTVESDQNSWSYSAFNSDGYELSLIYFATSEYYTIHLHAPILEEGQTFSWPTIGPATLLPEPSSNVGSIQTDSSMEFSVYVGEFSSEEYESYVNECIDAGFDVNYNRTNSYYDAENADGDSLYISYEGFDIYYIRLEIAEEEESAVEDEEETDDTEEVSAEASEDPIEARSEVPEGAADVEEEVPESGAEAAGESALVDGMRPEFKEAMDAYESFYDQYVDFMAAYESDPTDLTLMAQYFSMVGELVEMDEAFEAWDEDDLNSAELAYYLEVSAHVLQKLASVEY